MGRHACTWAGLHVAGLAGCQALAPRGAGYRPPPATGLVDAGRPAAAPAPDSQPALLPVEAPPASGSAHVLVLSGGGSYGAYTAGVLAGWSEAGTRPAFDVVTGVSTGALVGTLAFAGPDHDPALRRFYTRVTDRDVFARRPALAALLSDALADSRPLERLIDQAVDTDLLRRVAAEHAKGRRLYVGTTRLDTRRLVVWDMGAIAARGRPEDLALFRKVLLASASLPGLLPPVRIPVEVDGRPAEELHADGAVSASLFFRPPEAPADREAAAKDRPLAGSTVYVIVAGKLYADPGPVEPRFTSVVGAAVTSLTYAQTRGDLYQVYALALAAGMNYRVAAVPPGTPAPARSMDFDPAAMGRLYGAGRRQALSGRLWRATPPGAEAGEEEPARGGVRLASPPAPRPCPDGAAGASPPSVAGAGGN